MNIGFVKLGVEDCEICEENRMHVAFESKKINDQTDSISERDKGDAERRKTGINNTAKRSNKKGWLVGEKQRCEKEE